MWCDCPPLECQGKRADECRHRAMLEAGWIDPRGVELIKADIKQLGAKADLLSASADKIIHR